MFSPFSKFCAFVVRLARQTRCAQVLHWNAIGAERQASGEPRACWPSSVHKTSSLWPAGALERCGQKTIVHLAKQTRLARRTRCDQEMQALHWNASGSRQSAACSQQHFASAESARSRCERHASGEPRTCWPSLPDRRPLLSRACLGPRALALAPTDPHFSCRRGVAWQGKGADTAGTSLPAT